ncbi:MAG TPA: hypothetical protein VGR91_18085 [Stellaceae bacterium]|nr:hypothetical protein [Stellaceae bacterium]
MSDETAHFPSADESGPAVRAADGRSPGDPAALVARGIGGRVELAGDRVRLRKGGVFGHLVELLRLGHGVIENSIAIEQITAVEIVATMLLPSFIRISYAGGPTPTGRFLGDALAENALVMNLFDNRRFYQVKQRIERLQSAPLAARAPISNVGRATA